MVLELILIIVIFCSALLPVLAWRGTIRLSPEGAVRAMALLWLAVPLGLMLAAARHREAVSGVIDDAPDRPIAVSKDGYVGAQACRSCHPHEHRTWHASYHRTMTQVATPESIMAPLEDTSLEDGGQTFRLQRRGDQLWVHVPVRPDPSSPIIRLERPILMTTGSHHMQVCWYSLHGDSRCMVQFPFSYLKEFDRWVPDRSTFIRPPAQGAQFALGQWNTNCISCHVTHGQLRPEASGDTDLTASSFRIDTVDTHVAEFGISCEACHGPGAAHVRANRAPTRRYGSHLGRTVPETIVNPGRLDHVKASQICGQCHGIFELTDWASWAKDGWQYRPGTSLDDSTIRTLVRCSREPPAEIIQKRLAEEPEFIEKSFWSDGMVRASGREYNGLVETPCFQRGELSCLDCHEMHPDREQTRPLKEWANDQLAIGMESNQACVKCHQEYAGSDALIAHTHHAPTSSGSQCYNCHMSYTTYGLLKAIRSHQIDTPRVATSIETGRPNACNQCHLDKTMQWSADHLSSWYGAGQPELSDDERNVAASILWLLRGDAVQRALMAWSYGWTDAQTASGTEWMTPYLAQLLDDPYDAVRLIAYRSLRSLPGFETFDYDWLASPQSRAAARQRALETWQRAVASAAADRLPAHVLIEPQGRLSGADFQRLLEQRDDRPVQIAE